MTKAVIVWALVALMVAPSAGFHFPAALRVSRSPLLSRHAALALKADEKPSKTRAALAAAAPTKQWDASFRRRRLAIFAFTVVAYSAYYLVRNSIYYTAPAMVAAPDLNIDITAIGVISSVFPLTYGCSKFVSGVVGDVLSPRAMLASGLALTACVNVAFGFGSTLGWFVPSALHPRPTRSPHSSFLSLHTLYSLHLLFHRFVALWGLNGILQGWGGPACAKIITAWFAGGERGTYW